MREKKKSREPRKTRVRKDSAGGGDLFYLILSLLCRNETGANTMSWKGNNAALERTSHALSIHLCLRQTVQLTHVIIISQQNVIVETRPLFRREI